MDIKNFEATKIPTKMGKKYIKNNHYTEGIHNAPFCVGLFNRKGEWWTHNLIGVCAFATPISENVRASVFGEQHKEKVTELHRLYTEDNVPKNTGSYFISKSLEILSKEKPRIRAVVSFADTTEGHTGTQYQAANAWYTGTTSPTTYFKDETGRLRAPRQNGENITVTQAKNKGWRPVERDEKHRYVFPLPGSGDWGNRKKLKEKMKFETLEYP